MSEPRSDTATADRQRLDKWLWHARFARTRSLAVKLIADGHVRINGVRTDTPARPVRRGDVLTLALVRTAVVVRVCGFSERRGQAEEARHLYDIVSPAGP